MHASRTQAPSSLWVFYHDDHWVAAEEHLRDVAFFILGFCALSFAGGARARRLWHFSPHFARLLQHHVHVAVERLHARQDFTVVAAVHENLAVRLHSIGEQCERPLMENLFVRLVLLCLLVCFARIYHVYLKLLIVKQTLEYIAGKSFSNSNRLVKITIDRGRLVKNIDQLQIDREYLGECGDG